jgi:hypothetical protein
METEHDNLRTALAWALESGKSESALRLAGSLAYFWDLRGYWSEGGKWLDDALALSERERSGRAAGGDATIPARTDAEKARRAKALYAAGRLRFATLFEPVVSRTLVEASLHLWRELEDKWWHAVALEHLGFMSIAEGDSQTSRARLEEGVKLARDVEDPWPLALCLRRLASPLMLTDVAAAHRVLEEGVALARSIGDNNLLSQGLTALSSTYLIEGNLTAAASVAEEGLAGARAIGNISNIFLLLFFSVIISCFKGDPAKAKGYCLELLAIAREKGMVSNPLVLFPFAFVAIFGGQPERGVRLLVAFDALFDQSGIKLATVDMIKTRALEMARSQLDPAAFDAALQEGRALTLEQVIALATEGGSEGL